MSFTLRLSALIASPCSALISSIPGRSSGQGLVEYALLLVLVAMTVMAVLIVFGPSVGNTFSDITAQLSPLPGPG